MQMLSLENVPNRYICMTIFIFFEPILTKKAADKTKEKKEICQRDNFHITGRPDQSTAIWIWTGSLWMDVLFG